MTTPPAWLEALIEEIMNGIEAHSPGNFGYRYADADEDDPWEILLYPTPVELHGGTEDGALVEPGFSLDVKAVCDAFDTIDSLYWTAHSFGPHDQDNPSVTIEGRYQGHSVYVRILAYAPEDEPPGLTLELPSPDTDSLH
jgi:hypothetical protein